MKGDFADLERTAFMHANGLRAQSYSHVKQNQISQVGYLHILVSFGYIIFFSNFG